MLLEVKPIVLALMLCLVLSLVMTALVMLLLWVAVNRFLNVEVVLMLLISTVEFLANLLLVGLKMLLELVFLMRAEVWWRSLVKLIEVLWWALTRRQHLSLWALEVLWWCWLTWESHLVLILLLLVLVGVIIERFLVLIEVLVDWGSLWGWRAESRLLRLGWGKSLWRLVKLLLTENVLLLVEVVLLMMHGNRDRVLLVGVERF